MPFAPDSLFVISEYDKMKKDDPAEQAVRDRVVELAHVLADHSFSEISEVEVSMAAVSLSLHDAAAQLDQAAEQNMTPEQLKAQAAKLRALGSAISGVEPPAGSKIP